MAELFGKVETVRTLPKSSAGRKSDNPAVPIVQAAIGKGPQRVKVGADNVTKARGQLQRAAEQVFNEKGCITTRAPKSEPDYLYFEVKAPEDYVVPNSGTATKRPAAQ